MTLDELKTRLPAEPEIVKKVSSKLKKFRVDGLKPVVIAKAGKDSLPLSDKLIKYLKTHSYAWSLELRDEKYPGLSLRSLKGSIPTVLVDKEVLEAILSLPTKAKQYVIADGETHEIK